MNNRAFPIIVGVIFLISTVMGILGGIIVYLVNRNNILNRVMSGDTVALELLNDLIISTSNTLFYGSCTVSLFTLILNNHLFKK